MRGFTFIEMVVVVGIIGVLSIAVTDSVLSFLRVETSSSGQAISVTAAQGALDNIVGDLRQSNYGADGSYPLSSIAPNALTFFSAVGPNGVASRVTVQLHSTSLLESTTNPSGTPVVYGSASTTNNMAGGIQNISQNQPLFVYFDSSGNQITNFSLVNTVASVKVTILVNSDPNRLSSYTLSSFVTLRNLRSE